MRVIRDGYLVLGLKQVGALVLDQNGLVLAGRCQAGRVEQLPYLDDWIAELYRLPVDREFVSGANAPRI